MGSDWCLRGGIASFEEWMASVLGLGLLTTESGGEVRIFCRGIIRVEYAVGRRIGAGSNLGSEGSSNGDDDVVTGSNDLIDSCLLI